MSKLLPYSKLYRYLPIEILLFFNSEAKDGVIIEKKIYDFCVYYKNKYESPALPQPSPVSKICDILCENGHLSLLKKAGPDNTSSSYLCFLPEETKSDRTKQVILNKHLSYIIYGFKYIYDEYKKYVLPIEYTNIKGDISLGSCFIYQGGIATAKHCIEGAKKISILGIAKEELENAKFEIHENNLMDLIFIKFKVTIQPVLSKKGLFFVFQVPS